RDIRADSSGAAPLGGAAAIVGHGGYVLDAGHFDAGVLDGADRGLAARAGALDLDLDAAHAVFHGGAGRLLGRHLGGEGRRLAGAVETDVASGRPGQDVAAGVGDGDDRVVERGLDVSDPGRD